VGTNQDIETLIKGENIVRYIKSHRLVWCGHINRMEDKRNVKAIMNWNPIDKRLRGRPKTRWKDDVEVDLHAMKITERKKRAKYKFTWKKIIKQA
jgi:hypothetical protein